MRNHFVEIKLEWQNKAHCSIFVQPISYNFSTKIKWSVKGRWPRPPFLVFKNILKKKKNVADTQYPVNTRASVTHLRQLWFMMVHGLMCERSSTNRNVDANVQWPCLCRVSISFDGRLDLFKYDVGRPLLLFHYHRNLGKLLNYVQVDSLKKTALAFPQDQLLNLPLFRVATFELVQNSLTK